ncbi:hypothetical protein [Acinetobacter haemolyticus]|uniref:hypothetical protein n=1 Tax=Acinetobacter haemolyticus TaxID=29430 RepID=UPI001372BDFE|nr:hypothetical protein [Acinetobacter haemolyticus]NAR67127.1 hypothetical protein [Acinetobacter haemolyticus]
MKKLFLTTILCFSISISHSVELDLDNQNEALSDLADMFYSEKNDPVYQFETLNPKKLDYSIESLKLIDTYLSDLRKTNLDQISDDQRFKTILRTGAYVGEVIRKNDKNRKWYWVDYETAKEINPDFFKEKAHSIELAAVLTDGESFIFPLNKVVKFMQNGEEDSVYFFATVTLKS